MDMNRSYDESGMSSLGASSSSVNLPSGLEVESATFRSPVTSVPTTAETSTHGSGLKAKVDELKSRGSEILDSAKCAIRDKVDEITPIVNAKVSTLRSDVSDRVNSLRDGVKSKSMHVRDGVMTKSNDVQRDMAANPMKWAGISAGTGLVLGLVGRLMHHRKYHRQTLERRRMPQLVIIDASC